VLAQLVVAFAAHQGIIAIKMQPFLRTTNALRVTIALVGKSFLSMFAPKAFPAHWEVRVLHNALRAIIKTSWASPRVCNVLQGTIVKMVQRIFQLALRVRTVPLVLKLPLNTNVLQALTTAKLINSLFQLVSLALQECIATRQGFQTPVACAKWAIFVGVVLHRLHQKQIRPPMENVQLDTIVQLELVLLFPVPLEP